MVKSELKVLHIPEAVGLSFQGLDLVVGTLDDCAGDPVFEEVEQSDPLSGKGFSDPCECFYPGLSGVLEPDTEELVCFFGVILFPEETAS